MEPTHQGGKIQRPGCNHEQLAVEDGGSRGKRGEGVGDLRKVSCERLAVTAAQVHALASAERQAAEAVPLRFVHEPALRQLARQPREHGFDRRLQAV